MANVLHLKLSKFLPFNIQPFFYSKLLNEKEKDQMFT